MFTRTYPYGEIEPFSRPRFGKLPSLAKLRPDLPPWLDALLTRTLSPNPADRPGDVLELIWELETGPTQGSSMSHRKRPLYDRNPLMFWKVVSAALALALLLSLMHR